VWPDLLTDATFLPRAFVPPGGDGGGGLLVHGGFLAAFETVRPALEQVLSRVPAGCDVLFVGHSMGGSIAQIAAATFWARRPQLITFGAPATGNSEFAAHVNAHAQPNGGLRCWNQADVIVTIAMAAGYRHNGISLPGLARPGAIAAYEQARAGPAVPGIALAAPHVLYQLGGHVYAFPVLWSDSPPRAGGALRPPAADAADAAIAAADEAAAMRASAEQGRVASAVGAGAVQLGDDGYDGVADGPVLVA
jgi:pimeloyl-ACP methyl ester carboxylesterase